MPETETRDLIIKVPKPDEEGDCNPECKMYNGEYDCCALDYNLSSSKWCKPSPGCPWWEGEK